MQKKRDKKFPESTFFGGRVGWYLVAAICDAHECAFGHDVEFVAISPLYLIMFDIAHATQLALEPFPNANTRSRPASSIGD